MKRNNDIIFTILQGIVYFIGSLVLGFLVFSLLFYMQNIPLGVELGCCFIVEIYLVSFLIVVLVKFFVWLATR